MTMERSIPACAGEPCLLRITANTGGVYPRVCGGTRRARTEVAQRQGLSPRVRGNPRPPRARYQGAGSIPACAGEPRLVDCTNVTYAVYPRVCGGTSLNAGTPVHPEGLSPRVRGNPTGTSLVREWRGSIPACAGEPSSWNGRGLRFRVYPRVCGGTEFDMSDIRSLRGLSPRVRGNLIERP